MLETNPLQDESHKCFNDLEALTYLIPFKEDYPTGSKFEYNGTVCFCNDRDNCNSSDKLLLQNWTFLAALMTVFLFGR